MSLHQQPPTAGTEAAHQARLFGRYLLTERLSRGGMGELFVARHGLTGFEKRVVIKKVLPHLAADHEFLTRFIDEAQVAVKLSHANIAQVFEVGRVDDEYFLALEHIDGRDLRAVLSALASKGAVMPPAIALFIARETASGLAYAHRRTGAGGEPLALVHCDISPPNIMMSFDGETKIIDFGIARSALRLSQTDPDRGFGKFGYMSPEQLMRGSAVDHRSDIYSVGVLLFEMLTGRRLVEIGESPDYHALARRVVRGEHLLPGDLDPALASFDALVEQALAADVDDRFQTAAELRDALQARLARIDPTFNADHLATFMRELFGPRRRASSLDADALVHWQRELTYQEASTVSFAGPADPLPPLQVAEGTPSAISQSLTLELGPDVRIGRRRAPWLIAGALAAGLLIGGLGWALSSGARGASPAAPRPSATIAAPAAPAIPPAPPEPIVSPLYLPADAPATTAPID